MARVALPWLITLLPLTVFLLACPATAIVSEFRYRGDICNEAPNPQQCVQTLRTLAETLKQDPYQAVHSALTTSLDKAQTLKGTLSELTNLRGLYPNDRIALKDCLDELDDSVDNLRKSVKEAEQYMVNVTDQDFVLHKLNVQAWVSAVMTNHQACEEAFDIPTLNAQIKTEVDKGLPDSKSAAELALVVIENLGPNHRQQR